MIVGWGTSLGLILMAVGCCYPGLRNGEWLTWLPMLIADQFWRQNFFDNGHPGLALADLPDDESFPDNFVEVAVAATEPQPTEQMVQQLFRVRDAEGYEVIYGTVRADFLAGRRSAPTSSLVNATPSFTSDSVRPCRPSPMSKPTPANGPMRGFRWRKRFRMACDWRSSSANRPRKRVTSPSTWRPRRWRGESMQIGRWPLQIGNCSASGTSNLKWPMANLQ